MNSNATASVRAAVDKTPAVSSLTVYANNLTKRVVLEAQKDVPQACVAPAATRTAP
jgi:hypothetical protein